MNQEACDILNQSIYDRSQKLATEESLREKEYYQNLKNEIVPKYKNSMMRIVAPKGNIEIFEMRIDDADLLHCLLTFKTDIFDGNKLICTNAHFIGLCVEFCKERYPQSLNDMLKIRNEAMACELLHKNGYTILNGIEDIKDFPVVWKATKNIVNRLETYLANESDDDFINLVYDFPTYEYQATEQKGDKGWYYTNVKVPIRKRKIIARHAVAYLTI